MLGCSFDEKSFMMTDPHNQGKLLSTITTFIILDVGKKVIAENI